MNKSKSLCLKLQFIQPDVSTSLELLYADSGIKAGFPSPAEDYIRETIDLNKHLIPHPTSTFYARVVGDSMIEEGIEENDMLVIDRSLQPEEGDLAVCCLDGEFTLKRIHILDEGVALMPSNQNYKPIIVAPDDDFTVWGIVTHTIKANRRPRRHL